MKIKRQISMVACALLVFWAMTGLAQAQWLNNNEVAFTGALTSVSVNGEGVGTLFVHMNTVALRVIVNSKTQLENQSGAEITMDDLAGMMVDDAGQPVGEGPLVRVMGKFSSSGILATLVNVLDSGGSNTFRLKGTINQIAPSSDGTSLVVSLLGMRILATPATIIDGGLGSVLNLSVGTKVEVEGNIDELTGDWSAVTISILKQNKGRGSLVFEGQVNSYDEGTGLLQVAVSGVEGTFTPVQITEATSIVGELMLGVMVQVSGVLQADMMTVTAKKIMVLSALEIKPDVLKLTVGTTGQLTVKLREIRDADVGITLVSDNTATATVPESITIPAGTKTATFDVAALAVGTTLITASDGTNTATAEVRVGELSEDETDPPAAEVRIAFAPDHVKLEVNESREVVLLIKPPQKGAIIVPLTVDPSGLFSINEEVIALGNGAANQKVMLTAGPTEGSGTLTATLPAELGVGTAELIVEVVKSKGKK
jgi:hypothetical protein